MKLNTKLLFVKIKISELPDLKNHEYGFQSQDLL